MSKFQAVTSKSNGTSVCSHSVHRIHRMKPRENYTFTVVLIYLWNTENVNGYLLPYPSAWNA